MVESLNIPIVDIGRPAIAAGGPLALLFELLEPALARGAELLWVAGWEAPVFAAAPSQ